LLHHREDVEDAFQATFLVLIQKATTIRKRATLASWLYGVAYRTAMKAKCSTARRHTHESRLQSCPVEQPAQAAALRELHTILEREIHRLPDKYRAPFVLCCVELKTREEAARALGWKEGTVAGRLAQARQLLQQRLARQGISLSTAIGAAALTESARAGAPAGLMDSLLHAAAGDTNAAISAQAIALAQSVLKGMAMSKTLLWSLFILTLSIVTCAVAARPSPAPLSPLADDPPHTAVTSRQPTTTPPHLVRADQYGDALPKGAVARIGSVRWWHGYGEQGCPLLYLPDGRSLAYCNAGKAVRILDAATGSELRRIEPQLDRINCFAISPDGKIMVTASYRSPVLRVWDVSSGKELRQVPADEKGPSSLAFNATGTLLAADTGQQVVRLWDVATWQEANRLPTSWVQSIVFLPDGKTLVTAGDGIRWWDFSTSREMRSLDKRLEAPHRIVLSPDGKTLAAVVRPRELYLWEAATGKEISRNVLGPDGIAWYVCFSPDGKTLACSNLGDAGVPTDALKTRFFAAATGRELDSWQEKVGCGPIVFSPDGKILAQVNRERIYLRDAKSGKELLQLPGLPAYVMAVGFTHDGTKLFASCLGGPTGLWDPINGQQIGAIKAPPEEFAGRAPMLLGAAMSAGGDIAALVDAKGILHVWRPATGEGLCRISVPPVGHDQANFSPDGRILVVKHQDDIIRLWDVSSGKLRCELPKHGMIRFPHPHAFSPDGRILATAPSSLDKSAVRLWDTVTGKETRQLVWEDKSSPTCLVFSPDGKYLAAAHGSDDELRGSAGFSVRLWDLASARELRRLPTQANDIRALVFSPDGKTLAAGAWDTIVLWEFASGKERGTFRGHAAWIWSLAFSPDGRLLASGSLDYTALVWDVTGSSPDGRSFSRDVSPTEIERLWTDLESADAVRSFRAMWQLIAASRTAVSFLSRHLQPESPAKEERLRRLIDNLDDNQFEIREQASIELQELGPLAERHLRMALAGHPSAEARRRLESLLDKVQKQSLSIKQLQSLRALEVLEHIGSPDARQVLMALAQGAPESRLTQESQASLARLAK
jgi:RNA polymerase sigma factor (sigma-70 family)